MLIPGVLSAEEPTYMLDSGFILLTWVYPHGETEKTSCPNFTELLMSLRSYLSPFFFFQNNPPRPGPSCSEPVINLTDWQAVAVLVKVVLG